MKILVLNCGSSSIKYKLFDMTTKEVLAQGGIEKIGLVGSFLKLTLPNGEKKILEKDIPEHTAGIEFILNTLVSPEYGAIKSLDEINAVGHRMVHGGERFSESVLLNKEVLDAFIACNDLAPLHNPANLKGVNAVSAILPNVPQVGVFDTAFHQTMPDYAYMYALPYEFYEKDGIRKYGFHGTSHRYVSGRCIELLGGKAEGTKIVTCHLGNGSSISAVKDGKCFDTTMGLTPLEGIIMGTRCGSIDPAIIPVIMKSHNLTPDEVDHLMNKKSGMLGLAGTSDNRTIEQMSKDGDKKAQLVENMLCHQLTKYIGGFAAAMGGVDAIVFTGGIGENNPHYRTRVAEKIKFLGTEIDEEKNSIRGEEVEISVPGSKVKMFVIPTNEELVIARVTLEIVNNL